MPAIKHLSYTPIWEHTLTEILNLDPKSEMGIIMRAWVKHNTVEDFNSLCTYKTKDFTPWSCGNLHFQSFWPIVGAMLI